MSATVKERPILFSAPMVKALIENRKTQTRRIYKPKAYASTSDTPHAHECPYGKPGDRLWVRETWAMNDVKYGWGEIPKERPSSFGGIVYRADGDWKDQFEVVDGDIPPWKSSIHMPRWASRITLEISDVRVERVQQITNRDAVAEGVFIVAQKHPELKPVELYRELWDSINGNWSENPFVWVIEFRKVAG